MTTNGLSRIDETNESAIAPQAPASGGGRLSGRRNKKAQPMEQVAPPDTAEPKSEFSALQAEVLGNVAGQLTEVVETTDEMIEKMKRGAAEYLIQRANNCAPDVAATVKERIGGVNNAAHFRADAENIANAFLSRLGANAPD